MSLIFYASFLWYSRMKCFSLKHEKQIPFVFVSGHLFKMYSCTCGCASVFLRNLCIRPVFWLNDFFWFLCQCLNVFLLVLQYILSWRLDLVFALYIKLVMLSGQYGLFIQLQFSPCVYPCDYFFTFMYIDNWFDVAFEENSPL